MSRTVKTLWNEVWFKIHMLLLLTMFFPHNLQQTLLIQLVHASTIRQKLLTIRGCLFLYPSIPYPVHQGVPIFTRMLPLHPNNLNQILKVSPFSLQYKQHSRLFYACPLLSYSLMTHACSSSHSKLVSSSTQSS